MTWLFSKALMDSVSLPCSQGLEAESSEATCSDGEPSAQWNVMPTPQGFWRNDKMMDASRLSQFGPTLRLLKAVHGEAVLTSFLEGFPVRTYPQPVGAKGSAGQGQDSGLSSLESLAKYDPDTCSWKTPQYSLLGGLEQFSGAWPRWGTMQNGVCWALPMWELRTRGIGSGLWQTPVADDAANRKSGKWNSRGEPKLSGQVLSPLHWPTPTVCGNYNRKGASKTSGDGLATAVRKWPTPTAGSAHSAGTMQEWGGSQNWVRKEMPEFAGGHLNPTWVEWLMGWPEGWTEFAPLAMAKFREWQKQHSINFGSD